MGKVAIYARVSTDDQVDKYGLPAQLRACREYASAKFLGVIVAEISDEGISGATMDRPGLEKLREMVRRGDVDVVLALDPDRLSRDLVHLLILKPEIEKRGARLEFVTASFDDTPTGRLFFNLKGSIAEYEREVIRDRTVRGKREKAKSGKPVGGRAPYGYRFSEAGFDVDTERAEIIRNVYQWYAGGMSIRAVTRKLRESGAPTWGGGRWGHSSVQWLLRSQAYIGVTKWGKRDQIIIPITPIIDRGLWESVQERMDKNPYTGRPTAKYLLRGLLFCGCGSKMYGAVTGGPYSYYRCRGRDKIKIDGCGASVRSELIDAAAWKAISEQLTSSVAVWNCVRSHREAVLSSDPALIGRLRVRARKLKQQEAQALALMLDPDFAEARDEIRCRYRQAKQDRAAVDAEIANAERASMPVTADWVNEVAALFRRQLPRITEPEMRQRFVRGLVHRAEYAAGRLTARCFIGPKLTSSSQQIGQLNPIEIVLTARVA
jgi:site-specific DNA recombinase